MYLAGQVAENLDCGIKNRPRTCCVRSTRCSRHCGTNKSRILSATVYVRDMKLKPEMDEAWLAWVDQQNPPARATVQAELGSPDTLVEIMCTAAKAP